MRRICEFPNDLLRAGNLEDLWLTGARLLVSGIADDRIAIGQPLKSGYAQPRKSVDVLLAEFPDHLQILIEFLQPMRVAQGQQQMSVGQTQSHVNVSCDRNAP